MKRRILSLLLALGMVVSVLTAGSVYAEDIDGTVTEIGGGWAVKYSTTEAYNGSRSAHFIQMDGPNWDYNGNLSDLGMEAGKEYTLSFYIKGTIGSLAISFGEVPWGTEGNSALVVITNNELSDATKGGTYKQLEFSEVDNGWKKFVYKADVTNNDIQLFWKKDDRTVSNDFYIDDISITDENGNELITNGGFEEKVLPTRDDKIITEFRNSDEKPALTYSAAEASEGDWSLRIYGGYDDNQRNDLPLSATLSAFGLTAGNEYTLSYDYKGTLYSWAIRFGEIIKYWNNAFNEGETAEDTRNKIKTTDLENGWKRFSYTTTINEDALSQTLFSEGWTDSYSRNDFYMDNFSIKDKAGNEYVKNGGFEIQEPVTPDGARVDYEPKNPLVTIANANKLNISWRNPAAPALSKVSLYEITTGKSVLLSDTLSTGADAVCGYTADASSGIHVYKLIYNFEDGKNTEVVLAKAAKEDRWNTETVGSWSLNGASSVDNPPVSAVYDYNVYNSAAPSIRVYSNIAEYKDGVVAELTLQPAQSLQANQKYRLTYSIKGNNIAFAWLRGGNWETDLTFPVLWEKVESFSDWETKTVDFTAKGSDYGIQLAIINPTEDMWLDDISIYALDENDNITGNNLFEGVGTGDNITRTANLDNVKIGKNYNNGATVQWKAAADTMAAVYLKDGEELKLRAYVPASLGSVNIENLINDEDAELVVKAVKEGVPSEGISVMAHPIPDPVVFGEYNMTTNNNERTVTITVKNNAAGDNYTAQLILATYDGDMLLNIAKTSEPISIPQTEANATPVTLTETITLEEGETLKAFLWDSIEGMTPLKPMEILVEQPQQ